MNAAEAYEQAKKNWPTPEQELKGVRSDIAYCVAKGELHIKYNQLFCHIGTNTALIEDGYEIDVRMQENTVTVSWYKDYNPLKLT